MIKSTFLLFSLISLSCGQKSETKMLNGSNSCDVDSICITSYSYGENKDESRVIDLFTGIEDSRISHDVRYKGMSVYYCKIVALKKISGINITVTEREKPNIDKIQKFIDWAVENQVIDEKENLELKSCVQ